MKHRKPRFWLYPDYPRPKILRAYATLDPKFRTGPEAAARLRWPADCRWWNYSDRPAPYKPGTQR
jgi:hypothetical protein